MSSCAVLDYVDDGPATDGLNSGNVADGGRDHDGRLAGIEDGQAAPNFTRVAAVGRNVDVGAGTGADEELVVRPHRNLVVVAICDGRRGRDRHRAQIDRGNFAAGGGQGRGRRTRAVLAPGFVPAT